MIAFVAPGQGSEHPRMGLDLADHDDPAKRALDLAAGALDFDLRECLEGRGRALTRTETIQPALTAVALAAGAAVNARGIQADYTLGHSAGEVAAVALAGGFDVEVAVRASRVRGRAMQAAAEAKAGGMAVFEADSEAAVAKLLVGRESSLFYAGHVASRRHLVSGEDSALRALLREHPGERLEVAGAWHCALMESARATFHDHLDSTGIAPLARTFVSSETARALHAPNDVRRALERQVVAPLHFHAAVTFAIARGVRHFVLLGPSKPLRALLRAREAEGVHLYPIERVEDLNRLEEALAK